MNDFPIGTVVDVSADGDTVLNEFQGIVIGYRDNWIQVRDQEDSVFDCDRAQLAVAGWREAVV